MKEIDIKFSLFCGFSILCFLSVFCSSRKTEIIEFSDPQSKVNVASFIIYNPPENIDSLRILFFEHFQSSTKKRYEHLYYKENWFTNRSYIERGERYSFYDDYLRHRHNDLLFRVLFVKSEYDPSSIRTVIEFYHNGERQ